MKKFLSLMLAFCLLLTMLCGCGLKAEEELETVTLDDGTQRSLANAENVSTEKTDEQFYQFQIDINPSIVLTYNETDYVICAAANNEDAEAVLGDLDLLGMSIEDAFVCAALKAYQLGFDTDNFDIDVSGANNGHDIRDVDKLQEAIERAFETINDYIPVVINNVNGTTISCDEPETERSVDDFFAEEYEEIYRAQLAGYIVKMDIEGVPVVCSECGGAGSVTCPACGGDPSETCPDCGGDGVIENTEPEWIVCTVCGGTGLDYTNIQALTGEPGACYRCNNGQSGDCENPGYERNPAYDREDEICHTCEGEGIVYNNSCDTCRDPYGVCTGQISCSACGGCGEQYITETVTDWVSVDYYQMLINDGVKVEVIDEYYD